MPLDHFDLIAPVYDRAAKYFSLQTMLRLADPPPCGRLLDVGGGTGRVAEALRGCVMQVVVADPSLGMLRRAALKPGLQTACAASEGLPFSDNSFECIIMVDALHHVLDPAETAWEMWRVLQPCGSIVIQEPDVRTLGVKMIALIEKLLLMRSHFLSPPEIVRLFQFTGADVRVEHDGASAWILVRKT
jgi:demethylmenaquinone methyltransferase/2-methoxy-6-polyprenyl-1,4-benzoquinol methylase